jgi:hypothetical protein
MRPLICTLPIWIAVVATAWGPQAAPTLQSLRFFDSIERAGSLGASSSLTTAGSESEPWETRANPIVQVLAKLEQAAVAGLAVTGDSDREPTCRLVRPTLVSPALLRLAHDLSHVRLLI